MNEIICPHCSKAFKIDEAGYADILKRGVREFVFDFRDKVLSKLSEILVRRPS